jgi:DNA-binding Lrp family transcriptional regulator
MRGFQPEGWKVRRPAASGCACRVAFIEMHSVTGDDCVIARVVARSVIELAEILQRLTVLSDSSTSVVLETIIPLRNPRKTPRSLTAEANDPG